MADHAIFVFQISGHFIFHFDVVVFADGREASDEFGHTDKPLVEVKIVRTLIEQHAAAFPFPGGTPAAIVVVALGAEPIGDNPGGANQLAKFAFIKESFNFLPETIGALLKHGGK